MDAIDCLKTRRSIRAYRPDDVPQALVEDVVDCGRLAATAMNQQPWTFVVVRDAATRSALAETCGKGGAFLSQAPVCIAVFCRPTDFFVEDGSAATENLLLAAWAHGLGSCWVGGDKLPYAPRAAELLGAPPDQRLLALVALGYPAEEPRPDKRPLAGVLRLERF